MKSKNPQMNRPLSCDVVISTRTVLICILSKPRTVPNKSDEDVAIAKHDGKAAAFSVAPLTKFYNERR